MTEPTPTPTPPAPPPILLTTRQCRDWIDELSLKHCYVMAGNEYWRDPYGYALTADIAGAHRSLAGNVASAGDSLMIQLVDQELAAKIARRKCRAETLLGKPLVELLTLAPLNPTARARVMAAVGQMPPDAMDTWDKIKEWVEATYEPKKKPEPPKPPSPAGEGFRVTVDFSQVESGTCRYTGTTYGSSDFSVTPDVIEELLGDDPVSFEALLDNLRNRIMDDPWSNLDPDMDADNDTYEYHNHDVHDTDDSSSDISNEAHMSRDLAAYLRRTQSQEVIQRLDVP